MNNPGFRLDDDMKSNSKNAITTNKKTSVCGQAQSDQDLCTVHTFGCWKQTLKNGRFENKKNIKQSKGVKEESCIGRFVDHSNAMKSQGRRNDKQ